MEATYAIVEIMGHRSHSGLCQEVEMFGGKMLRIRTFGLPEVPETSRPATKRDGYYGNDDLWQEVALAGRYVTPAQPAVPMETLYYGAAAIFSLTPCSMEEALEYEKDRRPSARERWVADEPALLALPAAPANDNQSSGPTIEEEDEAIRREFFGVPGVEVVKTMITIAGSTERVVRNQMSEMQEAVQTLFVKGSSPVITFPAPEEDEYDVWCTRGEFITAAGSVEAVKAWQAFLRQTPVDASTSVDESGPDRWVSDGGAQ